GAIAPPLTARVMQALGWRLTFVVYGFLGLIWAAAFWPWYRDDPDEHAAVSPQERKWLRSWHSGKPESAHHTLVPRRRVLSNGSVWGLAGVTCGSSFSWFFFATWMPTYLEESLHFTSQQAAWLASLPFVAGVVGCLLGGWSSDRLVKVLGGPRWARPLVGL